MSKIIRLSTSDVAAFIGEHPHIPKEVLYNKIKQHQLPEDNDTFNEIVNEYFNDYQEVFIKNANKFNIDDLFKGMYENDKLYTSLREDIYNTVMARMINMDCCGFNDVVSDRFNDMFENNIVKFHEKRRAILDNLEKDLGIPINKEIEFRSLTISLKNGHKLVIKDASDGFVNKEIIKIKERTHKHYEIEYLPVYDKIHVNTYMRLFDYDSCRYVENFNGEIRSFIIYRNYNRWSGIRDSLITCGNEFVDSI